MTLTFSPLNRRDFCRNMLGGTFAAAILGSSNEIFAQDTGRDHWVFLTDPHIPSDPGEVRYGYKPFINFTNARDEILKLDHKPKGIIITGDIAFFEGTPNDYRQITEQITRFTERGIPIHMAFGNHDNFDNFYAVFSSLKKEASPVVNKHITVLETPNVNMFILDSLYRTDSASGLLGLEQLWWLKTALDARKDKPALVLAHHNLDNMADALMDREEFWGVIRSSPQVKAYIYGHTHVYRQGVRDKVHLINLPAVGCEFQSGKQPIGWNDVEISSKGIQLTLHAIAPGHSSDGDIRKFEWLR